MLLIGACFLHVRFFLSFVQLPNLLCPIFFFRHSICFFVLQNSAFRITKTYRKVFPFRTLYCRSPIKCRFDEGELAQAQRMPLFFPLFEKKIPYNGLKIYFHYGSHKNCNNIIDSVHIIACAVVISSCGIQTQQRSFPYFDMDLVGFCWKHKRNPPHLPNRCDTISFPKT